MREEISAAVVFLSRLIKLSDSIPQEKLDEFSNTLSENLLVRFKDHWYADEPTKGQGYRCIRINPSEPIDPVLESAANMVGLQYTDLKLPKEMTLWVDPKEVSCRFGESQGSFCQLAVLKEDGNLENQAHTVDIENHLKQQQHRLNMNINIVMTRTSANKLKAMAMKTQAYQRQLRSNFHNHKHQHNLYNNKQHPSSFNSQTRPFHNKPHSSNGYHINGTVHYNGYQGNNKAFNANVNPSYQNNKDRFHWVRHPKQHSPPPSFDQQEKMRLSPN